jgi:hypothetical protein
MLVPFSTPSRGIAILILPGGLLRFQIGVVTASELRVCVSAYGLSHRPTYRPRPRLMIDHGIGVIAHGTGVIDRALSHHLCDRLPA